MDLRALRYFAAVYETGNLTAAARRCLVSQPSMSVAIAGLEDELGTALFLRHKKGVSPTAAAEQLHPIARRLIDETEALRGLFRAPAPRRTLTIGLMRTLDIPRTMALLASVTSAPALDLRLVADDEPCDARVISDGMATAKERFVPLWRERFVVALPATHPLTLKDRLRPADLVGLPLIDRCHCEHRALFARARHHFETVAIAQSEEWALALVAAGVGIAILPEGIARQGQGVAVRAIEGIDVERVVGLAYGGTRAASAEVHALVGALRPKQVRRAARAGRSAPRRRSLPA
jgi:DNA-binding transcriptional LysR family regulator